MADYERVYYCFCGDNCKFETMTKEQIIAAIAEATGNTPTEIDKAFITKIKEQNKGNTLTFWIGTTAEYNALETKDDFCYYIKTDDTTIDDISKAIEKLTKKIPQFIVQSFSISGDVAPQTEWLPQIDITTENYTPIGIVGFAVSGNASTRANIKLCQISNNTARANIFSFAETSTNSWTFKINVLFVSNN